MVRDQNGVVQIKNKIGKNEGYYNNFVIQSELKKKSQNINSLTSFFPYIGTPWFEIKTALFR